MRALAIVALLSLSVAALAAEAPQVTTPVNGDKLGPNTDITGQAAEKQFLIIYTDVFGRDGDEEVWIGKVPGIRHWTKEDGSFEFRISTPRPLTTYQTLLIYRIHVFAQRPGEDPGPETVVTCTAAQ
jgi:hypothetical protein